jgi:hypothetical protein
MPCQFCVIILRVASARVDAHARRMLIPRCTRTCSVYENSPSIVILGYDFLSLHSSDNAAL